MTTDDFRSGFVALVGRPNVGKSTLLNRILGEKVSITSTTAQTTRTQIRGVLNQAGAQIVFVDTPGIGKPRSALGQRLNQTANQARSDVDVICLVIDGRSGFGRGDQFVASKLDPTRTAVVVNKCDGLDHAKIAAQLAATAPLDADAYFPVSAQTGKGVLALVDYLVSKLPPGPAWYPTEQVSDMADAEWVAELVREQLLRITREEVPHSIATRVVELAWPYVRVEILVERESQKGIVIGKGGAVLREVGEKARAQLRPGTYLDLFVTVDKDWHQRADAVERLGY